MRKMRSLKMRLIGLSVLVHTIGLCQAKNPAIDSLIIKALNANENNYWFFAKSPNLMGDSKPNFELTVKMKYLYQIDSIIGFQRPNNNVGILLRCKNDSLTIWNGIGVVGDTLLWNGKQIPVQNNYDENLKLRMIETNSLIDLYFDYWVNVYNKLGFDYCKKEKMFCLNPVFNWR